MCNTVKVNLLIKGQEVEIELPIASDAPAEYAAVDIIDTQIIH
jgi:hypothetical protein